MAFLVDVRQQRQGLGVHCTELEEGMPAAAADHMNKGAAARGRTFTQADEMQVTSKDGVVHRCVEFDGMLLTATGADGGEVAEVVVAMDDGGAELRVLASESYLEAWQQVHVVDVQGEREAFVLLVEVAREEEDASIVSILKFS